MGDQEKTFTQPDVRNKLGPIRNLLKLLEREKDKLHPLVMEEMKECENSILYLSGEYGLLAEKSHD
jgi:hypothetical protein